MRKDVGWGEVWEKMREMWVSKGRCGEVCLGCAKCIGVGKDEEKCGQRWWEWEDVGKDLGSVKKCGER